MAMNRRQFLQVMAIASANGMLPQSVFAQRQHSTDLYEIPAFGQVRLLHFTDCHAQLLPIK